MMSLNTDSSSDSDQIHHLPCDIDWEMLDKSRFFFLGAALYSGVSCTLYPIIVLKTRQQLMPKAIPCLKMATSILRSEGYRAFYAGFGTSLFGIIPARALYMAALEVTKTNASTLASVRLGLSEDAASTAASAAAGLSAAMAAQLVWTPVDVVSQRLMAQGNVSTTVHAASSCVIGSKRYNGGLDVIRKIIHSDGVRGLYRGFGVSLLAYAPANALWWGSYSAAHRLIWGGVGVESGGGYAVAVQGLSAVVASGVSAMVTMPLDTIKTRLQVAERGGLPSVRSLVKEGGCYRGVGPRWAAMSLSSAAMITTYEFLKRLSSKNRETFA